MTDDAAIRLRWDTVGSQLDERGRRLVAAARCGVQVVAVSRQSRRSPRSPVRRSRGKKDLDA
jgi:hypothetical protein